MSSNDLGEYIGGVSVIRDITERKKAERKTREAKEFLENIFSTSADGIIITDGQGIITMVNAATERMLGYDRDDLIGRITSVLTPEGIPYKEHSRKYLEELFGKGAVTAYAFTWLKKDGSFIDVEVNTALLRNSEGTITGSVTSIRDITERKQHRESLKKAYDEMEQRVQERTIALRRSNEQLKQEIIERELAEKKLFEAKEVAEYANKAKSEFLANMSRSSYTFRRLLSLSIDGVLFQTKRLLQWIVGLGLAFAATGVGVALYLVWRVVFRTALPGWTSLAVLILVCTGLVLVSLGVIGLYIGKVFPQAKQRPLYIIDTVLDEQAS